MRGGAVGRGVTGEGTEGQVRHKAIGCGEMLLVEMWQVEVLGFAALSPRQA